MTRFQDSHCQSMKENHIGGISAPFSHISTTNSFFGQLGGGLCFINNSVDDSAVQKMAKIHPDQCHKATEEADVLWIYHPLVSDPSSYFSLYQTCSNPICYDITGHRHGVLIGTIKVIVTRRIMEAFDASGNMRVCFSRTNI